MADFSTAILNQVLADQRKAARIFHRSCASEGYKNLRQAASIHLPVALLADFSLALGIMKEVATKMRSQKEIDRLRQVGRAELSAMGVEVIEEERVDIDVALDAVPGPEDVTALLALGLKRARKDTGGRRFAGSGSPALVSALVGRLGGAVTIIGQQEDKQTDGQTGTVVENADAMPVPPVAMAVSTERVDGGEKPAETVPEASPDVSSNDAPLGSDAPKDPQFSAVPAPRPMPRPPAPPHFGASGARSGPLGTHTLGDGPRNASFDIGRRGELTEPAAPRSG